ncbi:YihY/virulence factor BrkB family protein [Patulibacter sp. NPDC049589]|uniref:YihY/virulence factor BrkB family protein n=1 Tax=Patulibacter sp. NPDC049589 TaxID=3154731 RepID=UPI00343022A9
MPLEHQDERETVAAKRENRGAHHEGPDSPTQLRSTKKATLERTFSEFQADNITDWAAALTYYSVLAVFPAIIALVSIVGLVGRSATDALLENIRDITPGPARDILTSAVENIAGSQGQAGVAFVIGLLLALNSASGYIAAFTRASNAIYEVEEGRPIWKLKPQQIGIVLVLILGLVLIVVGVVVTGPLATEAGKVIGVDSDAAVLVWDIAKIPVILLIVSGMFAFLFKATPNVKQPGIRFFSPGGVVALVLWILVTALFALYLGTVASYSKTYGSLGGVVAFLVWIWLTNVVILFGAEFNAELQRSQQIEAGETTSLDEPFLEPRDVSKLEKQARKGRADDDADRRGDDGTETASEDEADRRTREDGDRASGAAMTPAREPVARAAAPAGPVVERRTVRPRLERLRRIVGNDRGPGPR